MSTKSQESKVVFFRKPENILTLQEEHEWMHGCTIHIEKIIELDDRQYAFFCQNLLRDYPFIARNAELMAEDERGEYHCLLITDESRQDAVIVDSEGYNYARYAAFAKDIRVFDLTDIPVERESDGETTKKKARVEHVR